MKWFRLDTDAIRHPKIAKLSDKDFRFWVQLLSIACTNDGEIPSASDIALILRERCDYAERALKRLRNLSLIEPKDDGYVPHNWDKYQAKSYSSTERVRRHRGKCNVTETPYNTIHNNTEHISSLRSDKKTSPKKVLKKTQLEENDYPDERDIEIASRAGMSAVTLDLEWQGFRAHHMAKGSLMSNWNQAWVTWVTNWKKFGAKQAQSGTNGASGNKYDWSKELAELAERKREKNHGDEKNWQTH
jgi:N-terminal phage replisome organiser (Phage_rep_org_N)